MKVIFNGMRTNEIKPKISKKIECECSSVFEYDNDDIQIEYGEQFVQCPICSKRTYIDDFISLDKASYPIAFTRCCEPLFENGVPISSGAEFSSDEELNNEFQKFKVHLRKYINSCDESDPPYFYYSMCKDWLFIATRDDIEDNVWQIIVAQDYYSNWFYV